MKKNRRNFLKLAGMSGIGLISTGMTSGYESINRNVGQVPLKAETINKSGPFIPKDPLVPAPEWLQNTDMITWAPWFTSIDKPNTQNDIWSGYDIELEDVWVEKIVRLANVNGLKKVHEQVLKVKNGTFDGKSIKGVPLISHVPVSEIAFKQAHEQGFRVIPYVHFTDIHTFYADQDIFPFQHPEVLLTDADGKWVNILMDGTYRFNRFLICTNNPVYCKLSLAYIKKIMDWGADGLFIDNVDHRQECFAPDFTIKDPEFAPYVHEHLFPENTNDYAYSRFLESVYKLVKSYGDDKIVVLNSGIGTEFQKNGDCCMWESFIYGGNEWEGRQPEQSWEKIKESAIQNEWYLRSGRRITALSYLNPTSKEVKDDAFWAFSAARLVDFIWWAELKGTGAEILYQTHLGKALEPLNDTNGLSFRIFENGIIVLNDSTDKANLKLLLPASFKSNRLIDIYNSVSVPIKNKKIEIAVPQKSARIYFAS